MQVRYETALKDKQLAEQDTVLRASSLQLAQRKWIILTLILLLFLSVSVFAYFQQRSKKQQLLLQQKAEKEQIKTVMRVTESERSRIAADIHDGLGQIVTSLRLQLQRKSTTENILPIIGQLQAEIRQVAFDLMPAALTKGGLDTALSEYCHLIEKNTGVPVRFNTLWNNLNLQVEHQVHIYRIVQEWINNIIKYADASQIDLQVSADGKLILVTLEDDGNGFDPLVLPNSTGNGWTNINTRAKLIGAEVWVDSRAGKKGTLFTLELFQTTT